MGLIIMLYASFVLGTEYKNHPSKIFGKRIYSFTSFDSRTGLIFFPTTLRSNYWHAITLIVAPRILNILDQPLEQNYNPLSFLLVIFFA